MNEKLVCKLDMPDGSCCDVEKSMAIQDRPELLEHTTIDNTSEYVIYVAYVVGIADGFTVALQVHEAAPTYCIGEIYGINNSDITDAV